MFVRSQVALTVLLLLLSAPITVIAQERSNPQPVAGMGIMVGEVTPTSALVQLRLTKTDKLVKGDVPGMAGTVEFWLMERNKKRIRDATHQTVEATAENDFIARAYFKGLKPGTEYSCYAVIGKGKKPQRRGPAATFRTLPGPKQSKEVRFVVVTGMNYAKFHGDDRINRKLHKKQNNTALPKPYAGKDKHLGYPALASILKKEPHFFVGTGDNVYYDTPTRPRAKTITEMRRKWHEQFVQPRYRDLFARVPTYWMIDDHDYRVDDCDNSGDYDPSPALGKRVMLEQLPYGPGKNPKTYRTHRVSRELQVWFPENRLNRSPNKMKDGPKKSIWGAEQKAWLKKTLAASDAKFKLLLSPTPMIGPDDLRKTDNHTNHGGFRHERDEFFAWLQKTRLVGQAFQPDSNGHSRRIAISRQAGKPDVRYFSIVCGDRHWQYHSVHPVGVEEFSCGALVDANSRLGRKPGDPKSTDPKGLIKQVYAQKKRSGGFLMITVKPAAKDKPASLAFEWFDEFGKPLHRHVKQ